MKLARCKGMALAAFRLANYASYGTYARPKKESELYWATISAEDGLPAGSYQLGMILFDDDSDSSNVVRAEYWLKKAKAQGITLADFGLCLIAKRKTPQCLNANSP